MRRCTHDFRPHTRKSLLARLRFMRENGAPRLLIRNAQVGLAVVRSGRRWVNSNPSRYQRMLEQRYEER